MEVGDVKYIQGNPGHRIIQKKTTKSNLDRETSSSSVLSGLTSHSRTKGVTKVQVTTDKQTDGKKDLKSVYNIVKDNGNKTKERNIFTAIKAQKTPKNVSKTDGKVTPRIKLPNVVSKVKTASKQSTKSATSSKPTLQIPSLLLKNSKSQGKQSSAKGTPMSQDGPVDRYPAWEDIQTETGRNGSGNFLSTNVGHNEMPLDRLSEHPGTEANSRMDTALDVGNQTSMTQYDDDDDGWDTDLEDDRYPTRVSTVTHDERARVVYMAACKKFRITPSSSFLKGLKTGVVNLNNQGLGPLAAKAVALSLVTNDTVKNLKIAGNCIGRTGIRYLMDMLFENDIITHLDISDNDLQSYGAELMCETLEEDDVVVSLKASGNKFKEHDAEYFLRILKYHKTALRELDLSHNEFGEEGGKILGDALGSNDSLEILNLSWNQLRHEGMYHIAEGLKENTRLTHLDLSWNGIEDKGADMLASVAKVNDTIKYLNLVANRIGPEGMSHVLQGFCANKSLKVLKISKNPITFEGPIMALEIVNNYPECSLELLEFKDMCVPRSFFNLLQTVNGSKPKFKVKHGGYVNGFDSFQDALQRRDENAFNDPFMYLINYVNEHKLKWAELFNRLDTDKNFGISHEEFASGIKKAGIPITDTQLDILIERLDTNNDGEVDLGELLAGHKKYLKRIEKIKAESRPSTGQNQDTDGNTTNSDANGDTNNPDSQDQHDGQEQTESRDQPDSQNETESRDQPGSKDHTDINIITVAES